MIEIIRRTPYAVLVLTLAFIVSATWLASHMGTTILPTSTSTMPRIEQNTNINGFTLTQYNTYWIGATDGVMYVYNNMSFSVSQYHPPNFPSTPNIETPFLKLKAATNSAEGVKNDIDAILAASHNKYDNVIYYYLTYNPEFVAGPYAYEIKTVNEGSTIIDSTTYYTQVSSVTVQWSYINKTIQTLYSFLQLNAEQINPQVYYSAAYVFEQIQMAKLIAFYYRYNIFLNKSIEIISNASTTTYYYNYGANEYTVSPNTAFPLYYNNQIIKFTKEPIIISNNGAQTIENKYEVQVEGDPYPAYDTFTQILKAAQILIQNYGPHDGEILSVDPQTLGLMTNLIFYTYTNPLYPTALIYAYTGVKPEPWPAYNNAVENGAAQITSYEYFMPIYPAFVVPYNGEITGTIIQSNLYTTGVAKVLGGGNFYQTIITITNTGTITFTAKVPLIISKGEATKTILVTIYPAENTNTSWTTEIITTYRCISQKTITLTITEPITITKVTSVVMTKSFYMLVTITEEFPLYPTVPLLDITNGETTYIKIKYTTTTTTKELTFTSYYLTTVTNGSTTTTELTTTTTAVTVTFTTTLFDGFDTFTTGELTATNPLVFKPSFIAKLNNFTAGTTTIQIIEYTPGGSTTNTLTVFTTWQEIAFYTFTKTTTHTTDFEMSPAQIDEYMKSVAHFYSIPSNVFLTMYIANLSLSPTNGSYVASLSVSTKIYQNTTSVTYVTRNPYVTALMLIAKYTFSVSTSSTTNIITNTSYRTIRVGGYTTRVPVYSYTTKETTYYFTTYSANTLVLTYSTVSIITTYNGTTFINTTLTTGINSDVLTVMNQIYTENRKAAFDGEVLATKIAARNFFVGYVEMDNYINLVNIRKQWIIHPTPMYFKSYIVYSTTSVTTYTVYVLPGPGSTSYGTQTTEITIHYYTYKITTQVIGINTGYLDTFEALLFKAPASPLDLYTQLIKINYPAQFNLSFTSYYYITTTDSQGNTIIVEKSTTYSNAAAFVLVTETANPRDNVVVNIVYEQYTTFQNTIEISAGAGEPFTYSVILPYFIEVNFNTVTTYPAMQYYLSSVPYVYVMPLPEFGSTVTLQYTLTVLNYSVPLVLPYYYLTLVTTITQTYENGTPTVVTMSFYEYTVTYLTQQFPASTLIAYMSPVYLGVYLIYGMTESAQSYGITYELGHTTIKTVTIITGSYWLADNWYASWIQPVYKPVTGTTTYFIKTFTGDGWETETMTNVVTLYAVQFSQVLPLPTLWFYSISTYDYGQVFYFATELPDFPDLISTLVTNPVHQYSIVTDILTTNNSGQLTIVEKSAVYSYLNFVYGETPFYIIDVVSQYLKQSQIPVLYVPSVSGSSVEFDTYALPTFIAAKYTAVQVYPTLPPIATYGYEDNAVSYRIIQLSYRMPYYAAFYNIPSFASTVTKLPDAWKSAPIVMQMYLPNSYVFDMTIPLTSVNSNGLPVVTSEIVTRVTMYYGSPLPYTFTDVTYGGGLYTYNPASTTVSTP